MDPAQDSDESKENSQKVTPQENTIPIQNSQSAAQPSTFQSEIDSTHGQETSEPTQVLIPQTIDDQNKAPASRGKVFLLVFIIFLFLLFSALGGVTYAVAYEKIKLKNYPELQKKVAFAVQSIPFMPKTPKFLLAMSAFAHQDVTKQTYDISLAVDSKDLTSTLGLSKFDVEARGAIDYSDPKNPIGTLDLSLTKDFNIELRKKDNFLYFKINKIPSFLLSLLGVNPTQLEPIQGIWVAYDVSPLDTEARKSLQDEEVSPLSEEFVDENFEKYIDEKVLSKMKLTKDVLNGNMVYKISLEADAELIDHLGRKLEESSTSVKSYVYPGTSAEKDLKLSDMVKTLKWDIYIDAQKYYTRKIVISSNLEVDSASTGSLFLGTSTSPTGISKASLAFAVKFDKFGEEVVVEAPSEFMTFEEFSDLIAATVQDIYATNFKNIEAPE